jgi:hypothetical protein
MLASLRDTVLLVRDPVVFAALDHRLMAFNSFGVTLKWVPLGGRPRFRIDAKPLGRRSVRHFPNALAIRYVH